MAEGCGSCGVEDSTNEPPFLLQYKSEKETDGSDGHPRTTAQGLCEGGD